MSQNNIPHFSTTYAPELCKVCIVSSIVIPNLLYWFTYEELVEAARKGDFFQPLYEEGLRKFPRNAQRSSTH